MNLYYTYLIRSIHKGFYILYQKQIDTKSFEMSDPILHQLCQDKLAFPLNLLPVTFQLKQIA